VIVERLHAILVTAHLGLGLVLFSMVLITVLFAFKVDGKNKNKDKRTTASEITSNSSLREDN
jgi:heme A synthase